MSAARRALQAWVDTTNAHDADAYAKVITEDYTWRLWDSQTTGRDLSVDAWKEMWKAFPDLRIELLDAIEEGGRIAAKFRMSGTHRGPLRFRGTKSWERPFEATGRSFAVEGVGWYETRGGLVSDSWAYWQPAHLLQQLGLTPSP